MLFLVKKKKHYFTQSATVYFLLFLVIKNFQLYTKIKRIVYVPHHLDLIIF